MEENNTRRPNMIPGFRGFHGPAPAGPAVSGGPPPTAVRSVLEWFLSGPGDTASRVTYIAQAVLSAAARAPGTWVDLSAMPIRADLLPSVLAAAAVEAALPIFTTSRLVFESQGNQIRFVQGPA